MISNKDLQFFKDYGMNVYTEQQIHDEFLILENNNASMPISDEFIGVIQQRGYTVSWVNFEENQVAFSAENNSEKFDELAQEFIEENFGNPFAEYHKELMKELGAITAYGTAKEEDLDTEVTKENVEKAAKTFCKRALDAPNSDRLLE